MSSAAASSSDASSSSSSSSSPRSSLLVLIRHGHSVENEKMEQPGSRWGDATFCDDMESRDTPLSSKGKAQAQSLLEELNRVFPSFHDDDNNNHNDYDIQIVSSPLTRSLQTFQYGVLPWFRNHKSNQRSSTAAVAKALPLCTERIYTAADIGRPASQLQLEFPMIDFTSCPQKEEEPWWWEMDIATNNGDVPYEEWRPYGQGQWYAVPGEPWHVFEQRMKQLQEWILQQFQKHHEQQQQVQEQLAQGLEDDDAIVNRANGDHHHHTNGDATTTSSFTTNGNTGHDSKTTTTSSSCRNRQSRPLLLIMVTHWGVIRYLTGGKEVKNCEILSITPDEIAQRQQEAVVPGL